MCADSLSIVFLQVKLLKSLHMSLILGEHLGANVPGVFSSGDDQHSSLHHYGKTFTMTTVLNVSQIFNSLYILNT